MNGKVVWVLFVFLLQISIEIFNIRGCKIENLERGSSIWVPGSDVPAGIYLVRVKMGKMEFTKKMLYLK